MGKLKRAAVIGLSILSTNIGISKANASVIESDTENETPTELFAPNQTNLDTMGENDISFEEAMAECDYRVKEPWEYRNGREYAKAVGLVYDVGLSRGLERANRNFAGYAGAYVNHNVPPNEVGHIVIVPKDIRRDSQHIGYMTRQEAEYWQANGGRGYAQPRQQSGYDHGHEHHGGHPRGRAGEVLHDVDNVVRGVGEVIHGLNGLFGGRGR